MKLVMLNVYNGKGLIYVDNFQNEWDTFKYFDLFWGE